MYTHLSAFVLLIVTKAIFGKLRTSSVALVHRISNVSEYIRKTSKTSSEFPVIWIRKTSDIFGSICTSYTKRLRIYSKNFENIFRIPRSPNSKNFRHLRQRPCIVYRTSQNIFEKLRNHLRPFRYSEFGNLQTSSSSNVHRLPTETSSEFRILKTKISLLCSQNSRVG